MSMPLWAKSHGYYKPIRSELFGFYGSQLKISIPEPDGELMLTILDQDGNEQADIYVDGYSLIDAVRDVIDRYDQLPEGAKQWPMKPPNPTPPTEGNHP